MVWMVVVMTMMMVLVIIESECQLMEYFLQSEIACSLFYTDIVCVHYVIHMAVIQSPLLTKVHNFTWKCGKVWLC